MAEQPDLNSEILRWADQHRETTGRWPTETNEAYLPILEWADANLERIDEEEDPDNLFGGEPDSRED
jgi:hypothetical protein